MSAFEVAIREGWTADEFQRRFGLQGARVGVEESEEGFYAWIRAEGWTRIFPIEPCFASDPSKLIASIDAAITRNAQALRRKIQRTPRCYQASMSEGETDEP